MFVLWLQRVEVSKRVFSFFLLERLTNSTPGDNEVEIPCNSPDISMPEDAIPVFGDPTQPIIMEEEMDNNARREESEVHENISVLEIFEDESHPAVFETTVKHEAGFSYFYSFPEPYRQTRKHLKILTFS